MQDLLAGLQGSTVPDRVAFFAECLRLRRRERHLWSDTPLAKVLTVPEEWHLLAARAKLEQMSRAICGAMCSRKVRLSLSLVLALYMYMPISLHSPSYDQADPVAAFYAADGDGDGYLTLAEMQRALESLRLGFSPLDIAEIATLADRDGDGRVDLKDTLTPRPRPRPDSGRGAGL